MIIRRLAWAVRRSLPLLAMTGIVVAFGLPFQAGGAELAFPDLVKTRKTVAAGFGFQNAESSTITVKTYDAESGEILSDESYELDIKEDGPSRSAQPRERIIAGGVGIGDDGLSEFTVRVYDASDGRFLWEGRLNLGVSNSESETVPVVAAVRPRATVSRISRVIHSEGQPFFLLRVLNPQTGQLVWSDQFSTEAFIARPERVSRGVVRLEPPAPRDVDFRIQMFDESGRRLLWEDQVTPVAEGSGASLEWTEEGSEVNPEWLSGPRNPSIREAI